MELGVELELGKVLVNDWLHGWVTLLIIFDRIPLVVFYFQQSSHWTRDA